MKIPGQDCDRITWWRELRERAPTNGGFRLVLLALATWMDASGGSCFPSQAEIARAAGVSEKYANRVLTRAERLGWLRGWRVNHSGTRRSSKHYHASAPPAASLPALQEQPPPGAGLLWRNPRGRFRGSTPHRLPINPHPVYRSTPTRYGSSLHELPIGSIENGPRGEISPDVSDEVRLRRAVLELATTGMDSPSIAGVLHRYELSERTIAEWISAGPSAPFDQMQPASTEVDHD